MAQDITVKGAPVRIRDPWAPTLLPIITLGIYHLVWYYKIAVELKAYGDHTGDEQLQTINPVRALLALFPGVFLLGIPTLISYIQMAKHVQRAQQISGVYPEGLAYLWMVLIPYVGSYVVVYMVQSRLNGAWRAGSGQNAAPSVIAPPPTGAPMPTGMPTQSGE